MKIFNFLLIVVHLCESFSIFKNSSIIATALTDVIEKFFISQNISFEFLIFGEKTIEISDVLDEVLKNRNFNTKIKYIPYDTYSTKQLLIINGSAIILGEPEYMKNFNNITRVMTMYPKTIKLLTCTNNINDFYAQNFLTFGFPKTAQFQYFLNENDNNIELQIFEWFDENFCNKKFIKVINTFNKTSEKWSNKLENYQKFSKFHQCYLNVLVGSSQYYTKLDKKLSDFAFDLMEVVAHKGNFSVYREKFKIQLKNF
ncbi:hypothetical protein PVAND_003210 [Polypedilum vanderplanki]|uniref:Uncharacterized protein n=1 Tax=Polypedilum vanderplanki TaxID=319348 RepID=A0A9J6BUF1_POLVA|nr:hypothetical protein PVAND_003210 [Polypedilum vanderplanki]